MKDGKWHHVRIRMKNLDYVARARKKYLDTSLYEGSRLPSTVRC